VSGSTIIFPRAPGSRHYLIKYLNFVLSICLKNRVKSKGFEKHRIIPKVLGGVYEESNVVFLTRREHTIAHVLLSKAFPDNYKLGFCAYSMTRDPNGTMVSTKIYESLEYYQKCEEKGRIVAESNRRRKCNYGSKISAKLKGVPKSPEAIKKRTESFNETVSKLDDQGRKKVFGNRRGKTNSEDSNKKRSETVSSQTWYFMVNPDGSVATIRSSEHPGEGWSKGRKPR